MHQDRILKSILILTAFFQVDIPNHYYNDFKSTNYFLLTARNQIFKWLIHLQSLKSLPVRIGRNYKII